MCSAPLSGITVASSIVPKSISSRFSGQRAVESFTAAFVRGHLHEDAHDYQALCNPFPDFVKQQVRRLYCSGRLIQILVCAVGANAITAELLLQNSWGHAPDAAPDRRAKEPQDATRPRSGGERRVWLQSHTQDRAPSPR